MLTSALLLRRGAGARFSLIMLDKIAATCMFGATALTALFLVLPYDALAHDIPNEVTVQLFVKPSGQRLQLLVRVPLKAMRDVEFPEQKQGYLDLTRIEPTLNEAANLWIADAIDVYEDNSQLPHPRVAATRVSLESDKSFSSFDEAVAHVTGARLPDDTQCIGTRLCLMCCSSTRSIRINLAFQFILGSRA